MVKNITLSIILNQILCTKLKRGGFLKNQADKKIYFVQIYLQILRKLF